MGRDARDKHKFDMAFAFCKQRCTDLRTEERRKVVDTKLCILNHAKGSLQVIGIGTQHMYRPYQGTKQLSEYLITSMHAAEDTNGDIYIRNLAILVI